jgi:hypothetical protein
MMNATGNVGCNLDGVNTATITGNVFTVPGQVTGRAIVLGTHVEGVVQAGNAMSAGVT